MIERLVGSFAGRYGLSESTIDEETLDEARRRVTSKFGTQEWLTRVP